MHKGRRAAHTNHAAEKNGSAHSPLHSFTNRHIYIRLAKLTPHAGQ
jgi:hypothetical protein